MENNSQLILNNPFPGLRPFGLSESHLYFGREGQSEVIIKFLSQYKFASITGSSGSGKSSLVYCGVIPLLYGGLIKEAGYRWKVLSTRPGNTPVWNLAKSIAKLEKTDFTSNDDQDLINYYYSVLRRHSLGLKDAIDQLNLEENENLLLVFDQFEELFRFKESRNMLKYHNDEPEALIKLIVEATRQSSIPIYVIITMRSDFIGELSDFQELTEIFNNSNYLVPQMERTDFEKVITAPLRVANVKIENQLVQNILNSLENNHDQLPVLQHAMMRTWEFWRRHNSFDSPISMRDYMSAGKVENALSLHANEAFNELNDKQKELCRIIFKALTEKGKEGKGIRRPATIKEISELSQSQQSEVIEVIEAFRKPSRSFVTPGQDVVLNEDTTIDISHESLMRVWDKLKSWVNEESASAEMYLRLIGLAEMYQMGKTGLLKPPDLHLASNWKKTQKPNRAWASRYHPAIEKAMVYLNTSEQKHLFDEESKIRAQRKTLYRTRKFAIVAALFAIAFFVLMFFAYDQSQKAIKQKELTEQYAKILEGQKDTAVQMTQLKEYQRLLALRERDSLERSNELKLIKVEEQTEQAFQIAEDAAKSKEEIEQMALQIEQAKREAEAKAKLAEQGLSEVEVEKMFERKKRMQALSQNIALKATQINDPQLSALLAYHAYILNQENGGQINHPEIFRGLLNSLQKNKGKETMHLDGHTSGVTSIIFDPARNVLYSSDLGGKVLKWSFRRENPTPSTFLSDEDANTSIALTVDGRWIAVASERRTIQLLNSSQSNNQQARVFDAHVGEVKSVLFVPGRNAMVSLGSDDKIKYWDLLINEGKLLFEDAKSINCIAISPSGRYIVCATNSGAVYSYDIRREKEDILYRYNAPVMAITFDYESEKVAIGDRNGKVLIIGTNGKLLKEFSAHSSRVLALVFSPDNRMLATSGMDGIIRVWNSTDWNDLPVEIRDQEFWAQSLAFTPDSRQLLSASTNSNTIYRWPLKTQNLADEICSFINRQLTDQEWRIYIGDDVEYKEVCK